MQSSLRARLQSWQHAVPFAPRLQRIARLRRVAAGTEDGHGGDASLGGAPCISLLERSHWKKTFRTQSRVRIWCYCD